MSNKNRVALMLGLGLASGLCAGGLHECVREQPYPAVKGVILRSAARDLNKGDEQGNTPLMVAVEKGRFDIVKLLLENGVDDRITNANGKTALQLGLHQYANWVGGEVTEEARNILFIISALKAYRDSEELSKMWHGPLNIIEGHFDLQEGED